MKTNYFFIIALFFCLNTTAQVPGYMGRRFSVGYSNDFAPRIAGLCLTDGKVSENRSFNATHCFDIDYALSRRLSLCAAFQYSKMDFLVGGKDNPMYVEGYKYSTVYYLPPNDLPMDLSSKNVSIGLKFFRKNYINPFGRYTKVELILCMNTIDVFQNAFYTKTNDYYSSTPYERVNFVRDADKFKSLVVAYTFGKQRIIAHRVVLDWGLRAGLNTNFILGNSDLFGDLFLISGTPDDQSLAVHLKQEGNSRIFGAQFFRVHLGIKFLAF